MRTMTIGLEPDVRRSISLAKNQALQAFETGSYQGEYLTYSTIDQVFQVFSANRWIMIGKLQETGPSSLRALARALGRDVKRVHEDATVLLAEGVVERNADNKLFVPYETIHIDVTMTSRSDA